MAVITACMGHAYIIAQTHDDFGDKSFVSNIYKSSLFFAKLSGLLHCNITIYMQKTSKHGLACNHQGLKLNTEDDMVMKEGHDVYRVKLCFIDFLDLIFGCQIVVDWEKKNLMHVVISLSSLYLSLHCNTYVFPQPNKSLLYLVYIFLIIIIIFNIYQC